VHSNIAIFLAWMFAKNWSNFGLLQAIMSTIFLYRDDSPWKHLKKRPFSLFGHAFSHHGFGHLFANLYAVRQFCDTVENRLGRRKLAHLYLCSIAISTLYCWFWTSIRRDETVFYSHGASGAVCGIAACSLLLQNAPSVLAIGVVLETVLFAYQKSKPAMEKKSKPKIHFAAHFGGYLGGLLFYFLWRPASSPQPLPGPFFV